MLRADRDRICAELRSTNEKQGEMRLERIIDGVSHFCCLGIICKLYIPEQRNYDVRYETVRYDTFSSTLPPELAAKFGDRFGFMDFNMPAWRYAGHNVSLSYDLTQLNDNAGLTFSQIADMLEYFFEVED